MSSQLASECALCAEVLGFGDFLTGVLVAAFGIEERIDGRRDLVPALQRHSRNRGACFGLRRDRAMGPAMHQQKKVGPMLLRADVLRLALVVTGIEGDEGSAHASSLPFRLEAMLTQESENVRAGTSLSRVTISWL